MQTWFKGAKGKVFALRSLPLRVGVEVMGQVGVEKSLTGFSYLCFCLDSPGRATFDLVSVSSLSGHTPLCPLEVVDTQAFFRASQWLSCPTPALPPSE